jgi:Ca2+-binding RTX toxin-like protein
MAEFTGTPGPDVIVGTPHADTISSGLGDDMITGRGGDDVIIADVTFLPGLGQSNNDIVIVYGDDGDDSIFVGSGQDVVYGGKGDDHITLAAAGMGIPFIPDDGLDTVVFKYNSHSGRGIGHDVINVVQQGDVLVFLRKNTDSLADLSAQTRLIDAGENAYRSGSRAINPSRCTSTTITLISASRRKTKSTGTTSRPSMTSQRS